MSGAPDWLPSLNALRAFEAVARLRSFQGAAEELHVTSPAIQQQVRGLEEVLGRPLVVRQGRKLAVSMSAAEAALVLQDGFERIALATKMLRAAQPRGGIRVSIEPSFAALWLIPRLQHFTEAHPIEVLVEATSRLVDLHHNEADVAIRYTTNPPDAYSSRRLFEDETVAVCSPQLGAGVADRPPASRLDGQTLIHFAGQGPVHIQLDWSSWMRKVLGCTAKAKNNLRYTDYTSSLQAAIAGQGFALACKPLVQDTLASGLLVKPFDRGFQNGFGYFVVTAKLPKPHTDIQVFVDWLCREANDRTA